ncbi:MAG: tetratricopeptide repeat-containing sensor histidine kinase [Algibacter sp.]|uniref:tetratricopeptide repeat-containing sensor histidine kinase n=1 Tax=Algibacter sp. TaxID=1872428 RepID=UPI00329A6139
MNLFLARVIKISSVLILMLLAGRLSSQEKNETNLFSHQIQIKANQNKASSYFFKSASYFLEKEWDSTLVYAMRHLEVSGVKDDLVNYLHYFRGFSFKEKGLFDEARNEFNLIDPNFEFYYLVKKGLGVIALEKREFKAAISYLEPLTKLKQDQYNYLSKSEIFQNIGLCYHHLNEFAKAEDYLIENLKLREFQQDTLKLIGAYVNVANVYYEQYKDDLAISYFEKAYILSKTTKSIRKMVLTTLNMAVVEENRKDYKKALSYRKEYEKWKDSLNDQNKIYEVAKLEKEFAVKEKQKEVSLLKLENKAKVNERNGLLYSVLTLLILLGVTFYFYKEKTKANKIIIAQKEGLDELNATKDKLFSIVSHDLRSSVNALKTSNAKLLDNLEAKNLDALDEQLQNNSAIVNGAYNLLDNLLHWALLQTKQSYFEITSIRLFFIVEQMAYNYKPLMLENNLEFQNNVPKSVQVSADQESLKIVLRNLLDNAIKFSKPHGTINVYSELINDAYVDFVIEDSGIGMTEDTRLKLLEDSVLLSKKENENLVGTGLGLQLCKSMIKKNNGIFDIKSELGKGAKMIVSLPKTT